MLGLTCNLRIGVLLLLRGSGYSLLVQMKVPQFLSSKWPLGILRGEAVQGKPRQCQSKHVHEINLINSIAGDELQAKGKFQLLQAHGSVALADSLPRLYLWRSELIAAFVLFTYRELVLQDIQKCQTFCPLIISASKLQYRTWHPGFSTCAWWVLNCMPLADTAPFHPIKTNFLLWWRMHNQ